MKAESSLLTSCPAMQKLMLVNRQLLSAGTTWTEKCKFSAEM